MARASTLAPAPPKACKKRAAISSSMVGASAQAMLATVNRAERADQHRLAAGRSDSGP